MLDNITSSPSNDYDSEIRHIIPCYDFFHQQTIEIVKCINPDPTSWLDTGCGTGVLIEKALTNFPNTEFYLSDPSTEMLEQARNKLHSFINRVHFLNPMQTNDLPDKYNDNYDVITAIQSHHYLSQERRVAATKKCYNLLKNSGVYITFENTRPFTADGIAFGKRHWSEFQLNEKREIEKVEKHISRFDTEYFPISVEEHLALLKTSGFRIVELLWFSFMQSGYYSLK